MNHKSYTTFSSGLTKLLKRKTESEFCHITQLLFDASEQHFGDYDDYFSVESSCAYLWRYRTLDHYFLDEGLSQFLVSSTKDTTSDYCKALPFCELVESPLLCAEWMRQKWFFYKNGIAGGFAIHFPSKEKQRSVIVIPRYKVVIKNTIDTLNPTYFDYFFVASDGVDILLSNPSNINDGGSDDGQKWLLRLIYGLSLYIDAFPETVRPSKSSESCPQIYKGQRVVVSANEICREDKENSISPHWRRGHFRMLTSEKFTKKKGMTVFIRGTFVKGKSYDVMNDDSQSD